MNRTWVFNDTHIGVKRSGGTTPASAAALRDAVLSEFHRLLNTFPVNGDNVVINGDLTDTFSIDLGDALGLFEVLRAFAISHPDSLMHILVGNHDLSKRSFDLGTVEFLGKLLETQGKVVLVTEPERIGEGLYAIPHLTNQALFDQALTQVPQGVRFLLLHCNFDSPFAERSDHSLNLSREQALALKARGITMVLGHEHHRRTLLGGAVQIVGNQFPTSVADCVTPEGRPSTGKDCLVIEDGTCERRQTWRPEDESGGFTQIDVSDLLQDENLREVSGFVRVHGEVEAGTAADALRAISRLRQNSDAFVIANAVKVQHTGVEIEGILDGVEDVRKVDVIAMLMEVLTPDQQEAVRAVLALRQ